MRDEIFKLLPDGKKGINLLGDYGGGGGAEIAEG